MSNQKYIVVGAGHAGGRAVEAMRMAGFEGEIVLLGAEPHLPYERPPLSKEVLQARPDYKFPYIRPQEYYEKHNIELRLGVAAASIDAAVKAHDSEGYKKALDALGNAAIRDVIIIEGLE